MSSPPALNGPPGRFLTGHLAEFRADRLTFFTRCARDYGDVVPLRIVRHRVLLLSHPDLIEQVLVGRDKSGPKPFIKHFGLRLYGPILGNGLVTSEGDFWRRQRKLSAPAFQAGRLEAYAREMVESTERLADEWDARLAAPGTAAEPIDVHDEMMRVTLEIACRTLFGPDARADPAAVGVALYDALRTTQDRFGRLIPLPDWVPTPSARRLRRSMAVLNGIVLDLIAQRRGAAAKRGPGASPPGDDLLSMLLAACDESDGTGMTDRQLLDEARTVLLAGHETTALALTYALHLLALHPAAQDRMRAELAAVLGDRPPVYADLPQLPYTQNVVTEAMRLYPPADFLGREATADCTITGLDGRPIPVRRGTSLFASQWVMHRDPRYFPDPETFDPGRWTAEFEGSLPRFAYFPFGGGPRFCIGQTFATVEAGLMLAALCRRFTFAPAPGFRMELWPGITLRPAGAVPLVVTARRAGVPAHAAAGAGA